MGYELESIKTGYVDVGRVLNRMHLYDGLGHCVWLVPRLTLVFSGRQFT